MSLFPVPPRLAQFENSNKDVCMEPNKNNSRPSDLTELNLLQRMRGKEVNKHYPLIEQGGQVCTVNGTAAWKSTTGSLGAAQAP